MSATGYPADLAAAAARCTFCPKLCRHACPVSNATANESFTPWGKMTALRLLLAGQIDYTPETVTALYACTGCGRCTANCEHENEVALALFAGRRLARGRGLAPAPLAELADAYRRYGNAERIDLLDRLRALVPAELLVHGPETPPVVFFFDAATVADAPETVRAAVRLIARFKLREARIFGGPESCAGLPLLWSGAHEEFVEHARRLHSALARFPQLVTPSAELLAAARFYYPRYGLAAPLPIRHLADYLIPLVPAHAGVGEETPVFLKESCQLERAGLSAAPVTLLSRLLGRAPRLLPRHGANTECCGHAGLWRLVDPPSGAPMARQALAGLPPHSVVVCADAACAAFLSRQASVKVREITAFVADHLERA